TPPPQNQYPWTGSSCPHQTSSQQDMAALYAQLIVMTAPGPGPHRVTHAQEYLPHTLSLPHSTKSSLRVIKPGPDQTLNQPSIQQTDGGRRGGRGPTGARRACTWRKRRKMNQAEAAPVVPVKRRAESLQRRVDTLQHAQRQASHTTRELRQANRSTAARLDSLGDRLGSSKQLTQKLTCDLAGVELQKKVLEMELEQGPTAPNNPGLQALEAEVKQLQAKLKSGSAEVSRQASAIKALRSQLQEKEDKLAMLQDRASHSERDVVMKRQLVEDLRTRLKVLQDGEKSHRGQVEELERKVRSQSEEATNRKAFLESLKRRLSVATSEKSQHEASERLLGTLQGQVGAGQRSLAQLEQTATSQMEGLAQQSSQALDVLQRRLGLASSQTEQLHAFVKALAGEMLRDVQESVIRAKSIAASILNMSERDLADMLDGDQDTEPSAEMPDQDWLQHLHHILKQKLMEAVRVKMKERKVLTEELAALAVPVSEND
ncbi:hypothetical protein NHX12_018545, partial [Muraenolepis orangiensis]